MWGLYVNIFLKIFNKNNFYRFQHRKKSQFIRKICGGGTSTDSTVPTNTVQVLITTGTVTDSGSEYTGFFWGDKLLYIQGR